MKILVTGATGQVGAELIRRGSQQGCTMIPASHAKLDITHFDGVVATMKRHAPDLVMNAAAYTAVDTAEDEQDLAFAINGTGAEHLAKACSARQIPLFHISTDYIFDGTKDSPYSEEDTPNPQGIYGLSKLSGDRAVSQHLTQHLILRVAWVFGACGNNFVRTMLRLGHEHKELRIVADQFGGPTWAGDIATTLLDLAKRHDQGETLKWGTYNYSGAPTVNWHEFATAIFSEAVRLELLKESPTLTPITTAEYPTPATRPANSALDCRKIKQHFAVNQPNWRLGLHNTLQEWQQQ